MLFQYGSHLSWHQTKTKKLWAQYGDDSQNCFSYRLPRAWSMKPFVRKNIMLNRWNPSEDSVGSTASYISHKSFTFEAYVMLIVAVIRHFSLPTPSELRTKWNPQERYVASSYPDLTNHVECSNQRTNHWGENQTRSCLLPDCWRQSQTLLSIPLLELGFFLKEVTKQVKPTDFKHFLRLVLTVIIKEEITASLYKTAYDCCNLILCNVHPSFK